MELLSPAGNYQAALAALKGGSDAIYLGGKAFSARMSAENFSNEELEKIVNYAHLLNKKIFVTMNTLLYQDEFMEAVEFAKFLNQINVDGLIIQDLGLATYLHKTLPTLVLHASTQLNCHNIEQVKALKEIGFVRVVLAREANLELIKKTKALGMEVEVFIHGALCVSYSGNCLMSSFIGGRSGNRGRCAQPCRLNYELVNDNETLHEKNFAISTKDLMTLEYINALVELNVDSLKIEGRLKQNEYVYAVSKAYRHAIDACIERKNNNYLMQDKEMLVKIFSRKFTKGYLFNESPFNLLNQETSSHQGEKIGEVIKTGKNYVAIKLIKKIHRLDGIRFNNKNQFGLQIGKMFVNSNPVDEAFKGQIIEIKGINDPANLNHCEVIRTSDYLLIKSIEKELNNDIKIPVEGKLIAYINKPLSLEVKIDDIKFNVVGDLVLEAENRGTSLDRIKEQLAKSGDYPYYFDKVDFKGNDNIFIPISSLNKLRNEAFTKLMKLKSERKEIIEVDYDNDIKEYDYHNIRIASINENEEQYLVSKNNYLDSFKLHSNEFNNLNRIESKIDLSANETLVHFVIKGNGNQIASPYCNITNSYALDCYYNLGFKECLLSLELDYHSTKEIIDDFYSRHHFYPNVGVYTYGRIDLMLMKSCPVGTIYHNKNLHCQRCHNDDLYLKDRMNVKFPIIGDEYCNTRVLNAFPLYLNDKIEELKNIHINSFFLVFTKETTSEMETIIANANENLNYSQSIMSNEFTRGHFVKRAL